MANKNEVKIIITADGTLALSGTKKIKESLEDLTEKGKSFTGMMKDHWLAVTAGIGSAMGVVYTFKKVYNEFAAAFERQEKRIAFENLANSVGSNSLRIVSAVRAASGELLTIQGTIEASGRAILLGLQPDTITRLMQVARASTKVTGQTITAAFGDITLGVARQSKMILDNLGILVDYDTHLRRMQVSLGKTETELTDAERRQAFLNATFEAGDKIIERVGNNFDTLNERLNKFSTGAKDAWVSFADFITGVSTLDRAIGAAKYPGFVDIYGKQKEELDSLLPKLEDARKSMTAMLSGGEEPRLSVINKFTELENKVISLQKALNATNKTFGFAQTVPVFEKLIPEKEEPIPFDLKKWSEEQLKYEKEVGDAFREEGKFLEESRQRDVKSLKELSEARESDIQMQLRQIDLAEQEFRISKPEAVQERVRLQKELLSIQQQYVAGLDKANDPASWYAQMDAINDTREALVQLNLQLKEQTGTLAEGMQYGIQQWLHDAKTGFEHGKTIAQDTANAMQDFFSGISFDAMQGKLQTLGDYFRSFITSMQRSASQLFGQLAMQGIMMGISALTATPTVGGPIMVHTGGYIPRFHGGGLSSDDVPAILQRGEYVINRRAVDAVGKSTLDNINTGRGAGRSSNNYFIVDPEAAEAYSKMSERQLEARIARLMKDNRLKPIRR